MKLLSSRISHHKSITEEKKKLLFLEQNHKTDFPGAEIRLQCKKQWMSTLDLKVLKIKDLMWPGTHNSATDKIGILGISRPFAQCQKISVYEQLNRGIRCLDIRVQSDAHVCHGILRSYPVQVVVDDVKKFLTETSSEFIILEFRTERGHKDPPNFSRWLVDQFEPDLIHADESIFEAKLADLLPRRVICIWKPQYSPVPATGDPLFGPNFLKDNWVDTDLPLTKFNSNLEHLGLQQSNSIRKYFYRVEHTCTPQISSLVLTVHGVNERIKRFARFFISQAFENGLGDHLQIFSADFVEDDFVDACIGVTTAREKRILHNTAMQILDEQILAVTGGGYRPLLR